MMRTAGRVLGFAVIVGALLWPVVSRQLHKHGDARPSLRDAGRCPGSLSIPTTGNIDEIRQATLCLLNLRRAAAGLAPLQRDARLERASQLHSEDMDARRFFAHENPDGTRPGRRIRQALYRAPVTGENLAWGTGQEATPEHIVVSWMNSPGHRRNILDRRYAEVGVGVSPRPPRILTGQRAAIYTTDFGSGD